MNRRELLKLSSGALLAGTLPGTRLWAAPDDYTGEFLIQVQAGGAWDVSSYCDPKEDIKLNNWAKTKQTQTAGNLSYAPWADNDKLFDQHYDKMLVINGVNCYTNGHTAGRRYNFTGSNQADYPSLSAAFAATRQGQFPIPLLVNGGQFSSGNLIVPTRLGRDVNTFQTLLEPNSLNDRTIFAQEDIDLIDDFRNQRAQSGLAKTNLTSKRKFIEDFLVSNQRFENFKDFKQTLDSVNTDGFNMNENFNVQMLYALVGFKTGVTVAADTFLNGFDTHDNHDTRHEPRLRVLNEGLRLIWHVAEQLDLTERVNLFVASDFARTPKYNAGEGKDHWPIGSTLIMKAGVNWTNRVVGKTDAEQKADKLNPMSLLSDNSSNGVIVESSHVMEFGRKMMGIDQHPLLSSFDLRVPTSIDFSGGRL